MALNFNKSFLRDVPLHGEPCSWRKHLRYGVLREVLGYLDLRARQQPIDRFTWVSIDEIVAHCKRYKGPGYSKTAVEKALAFLEELAIIARIPEMIRNGKHYTGFFVADHDHACKDSGDGVCRFWCLVHYDPPDRVFVHSRRGCPTLRRSEWDRDKEKK